jgi:pimeloyl-ACP methyl ester carboxylesterase
VSGLAAAALLARFFGVPLPARRVRWHDIDLGRVAGDRPLKGRLWLADRRAPVIVLAAGLTPRGVADPRLVRLATALARTGRVVFAPQLALAQRRLDHVDVERVGAAVLRMRDHPVSTGQVAVLGFSFGGSYALVAASDPEVAGAVSRIAAFGAYADLSALIPAVRRMDRGSLRGYLDAARNGEDGVGLTLEEHRALSAVLLEGADPGTLPASVQQRLAALSPARARPIDCPVSLIHAVDDPVIPHRELGILAGALPHARMYSVELFTHVDFRPTPRRVGRAVRDLTSLWGFARDVLAVPSPRRRARTVVGA